MKVVFQLLFVAFYLAGSCATSADRSLDTAMDLQHLLGRTGTPSVSDTGKGPIQYTNFREAKKSGADIIHEFRALMELVAPTSVRQFHSQPISLKYFFAAERSPSRAPPVAL